MAPFDHFNTEKQAAIGSLGALRGILSELSELGVDVDEDLDKIKSAVDAVQSDVLRIALLGAFSDGKTSVVASWLGQVTEDMKIDLDESSDELTVYRPDGLDSRCEIVDTPGLFGDKEQTIDGHQVMYGDLTRRYISQAHLLFYVVDSTNPLKDSHSDIARWVLRDLGKLPTTIFVINKMDLVADLSDPAQFQTQSAIKKKSLVDKLRRVADLSDEEAARLQIVCMSSNPSGRGLDFWFTKRELYESRSRIRDLKGATSRILDDTIPAHLIAKTGFDVVRDLVARKLEVAQIETDKLESFSRQNTQEATRMSEDIGRGRAEIKRLAAQLFEHLLAIESQLTTKLRTLSMTELRTFLEDEIGYDDDEVGHKVQLRIKFAIDKFFDQSSAVVGRVSNELGHHLDGGESFLEAFGGGAARAASGALKQLSKMDPAVIKKSILVARNLLKRAIGMSVKFKPWEATKLAGNIGKWAGPAGAFIAIGMDAYAVYDASRREQALSESKEAIRKMIGKMFKEICDLLKDDDKMFAFFAPQIIEYEGVLTELQVAAERIRTNQEAIARIREQLVALPLPSPNGPVAVALA